jgi:ABC-type multidrug transport system permease subunit
MKKISKAIVKIFVAFLLIVIVYLIMISFPQVFLIPGNLKI